MVSDVKCLKCSHTRKTQPDKVDECSLGTICKNMTRKSLMLFVELLAKDLENANGKFVDFCQNSLEEVPNFDNNSGSRLERIVSTSEAEPFVESSKLDTFTGASYSLEESSFWKRVRQG